MLAPCRGDVSLAQHRRPRLLVDVKAPRVIQPVRALMTAPEDDQLPVVNRHARVARPRLGLVGGDLGKGTGRQQPQVRLRVLGRPLKVTAGKFAAALRLRYEET